MNRCEHWNTLIPPDIEVRPLRCTLSSGHDGKHAGGGSTWNDACGEYRPDSDEAAELERRQADANESQRLIDVWRARTRKAIDRAERAEADVEALRAEVWRMRVDNDLLAHGSRSLQARTESAIADRDRAVREALENAAQKIEQAGAYVGEKSDAARIVRSLIPEVTA